MDTPKSVSWGRKAVRLFGKILGGILALCLLVLVGALLWLRTSQADAYLSGLIVRTLAQQGYTLTFDQFTGPLPGHLLLRDAIIADKDGPLLRLKELEAEIFLSSLLTGTAELSLHLRGPELVRLPAPAAPAPAEPNGPISLSSLPVPRLPVDARLKEFCLEGAVLPLSVLIAGNLPAPPVVLGQTPKLVTLNARASALLAKGNLTADLEAAVATDAGQHLKLQLRAALDQAGGTLDLAGDLGVPTPAQGPGLNAEYALEAGLAGGEIRLKRLYLAGLGLETNLSGSLRPDDGKTTVTLTATAADKAPWQAILAEPAGFVPVEDFGGALTLSADAACDNLPGFGTEQRDIGAAAPALPRLSGKVELRGRNMRWPFPEGKELLGSDVHLAATLTGGGEQPLELRLEEVRAAGFRLAGQASVSGAASAARNPQVKQAGEPAPAPPFPGHLSAQLTLEVADLAVLGDGVAGPATVKLTAQGSLENLTAALALSAPELHIPAGILQGTEAHLDLAVRRSTAGDLSGEGTVSASVEQSPGGPGKLAAFWKAALPAGPGETTFALNNLSARFAGADLSGDCAIGLPRQDAAAGEAGNGAANGGKIGGGETANDKSDGGETGGGTSVPPRLSGALNLTVADWTGLAAVSGLPLRGTPAKLAIHLDETRGQSAALTLSVDSFTLDGQGLALQNLALDARAEHLWAEPAMQGTLRLGPGEAGPLRWGSAAANMAGQRAGTFSLVLNGNGQPGGRKAEGTSKPAGASGFSARSSSGFGGAGEILGLEGRYDLTKEEVVLSRFALNSPDRQTGVRLISPLTVGLAGGTEVKGLQLAFAPRGSLAADADLRPGSLRLAARLKEFSPAFCRLFTSAPLPDGTVDADLAYSNTHSGPTGSLKIQVRVAPATQTNPGNAPAAKSNAGASFREEPGDAILQLEAALGRGPGGLGLRGTGNVGLAGAPATDGGKLRFSVPLALGANGLPMPNNDGPLSASLAWQGSTAPLWRLAPMPGRSLDGRFAADMKVSGTTAAPVASGSVYLAGGCYEDKLLGVLLTDITLESHLDPKEGVRAILAAGDGRGGSLATQVALTPESILSLHGRLRHLRPLHRDDLSVTLSGILDAKGELASLSLGANILVEEGEVNIASSMGGGGVRTLDIGDAEAKGEPEKTAAGPTLAVHIEVPRRFFIRGKGLESEWQGNLRIVGSAAAPQLTGRLSPVRGTLDLLSKTFTFDKGEIIFTGGGRINPGINLELVNETSELTAVVQVSGNASKPKLELTSRPPLPRDEVLAHVLFGKNLSELSRFEALQLANSVRELAGVGEGGGFSPLTTMRKSMGLDMLRLSGGNTSDARTTSGMSGDKDAPGMPATQTRGSTSAPDSSLPSLEAGKYINDSIYVGVEQGASPESTGVRVEVELTPHINLQGKTSPTSSQLGVGWKLDY